MLSYSVSARPAPMSCLRWRSAASSSSMIAASVQVMSVQLAAVQVTYMLVMHHVMCVVKLQDSAGLLHLAWHHPPILT